MDERSQKRSGNSIIVTGVGCETDAGCDATPDLKVKKHRKFMGPQDRLAVVSAHNALESAGLRGEPLGERAGLYMAVGYIPFERADIDKLVENSLEEQRFSMAQFSSEGFYSVHPHLTFRCLSNMPAFHVSVNFDLQGPYFVTYPGIGQWYLALEEACFALRERRVDVAIVGAVAYQKNFLVAHHFGRIHPAVEEERLIDAAACLVLERNDSSRTARAGLLDFDVSYESHHPFEATPAFSERFAGGAGPSGEAGPASLALALSEHRNIVLDHSFSGRDGIQGRSRWEIHP